MVWVCVKKKNYRGWWYTREFIIKHYVDFVFIFVHYVLFWMGDLLRVLIF